MLFHSRECPALHSLQDLNSANGTFVNQRRLGSEEDFQLFVGDVIQFGQDVYDGNDRYSCVIVVAAEMIHPDGRHHNATRGDGCKESEAAGVKHEYQVEDEQQVALSALHDCLREVTVRELSISKRLNKTQTVLDEVRRAVADKWQGEVDQDILLSKISLLQQEVTSKNSEKNSSTMQRKLHYEENVKRMLYEASKGRVDAEVKVITVLKTWTMAFEFLVSQVRASKAEEKLESRSRTPASPPSSLPPPSTSPTASQRNSEELLEKLQQLAAAASSEVAFTQHQVASLQRSLTRLGRSHKLALDAIIAVSAFLAIVSALYLLSFQVKEQITLNTW